MVNNTDYYTGRHSGLRGEGLVKRARTLTLKTLSETTLPGTYFIWMDSRTDYPEKSVLELEFGDGLNALLMFKHGAKVTAIEIANPAVQVLRQAS